VSPAARFFDGERDSYVLGVLRVAVGLLVVVQTASRMLETFRSGYFGDVFHLPMIPEAWVPSLPVYLLLQVIALVGGGLAVVGFQGRAGLLVSAAVGLFLLLANRLDYHNNRFALLLVALLTAFTPCDRSLLLARGASHTLSEAERRAPRFAANLIGLTVSAVYLSSAGGKLLDSDWRGGQTLLVRFARSLEHLTERYGALPDTLVALWTSPAFASVAAKSAISLELALAVTLWLPKLRPLALYAGALFHLNIELTARVELFSYVMGAAYVAFVTPEVRERIVELDPSTGTGQLVGRGLPWVDWLARFRVEGCPGAAFRVRDRGGAWREGWGALAELSRATPVLFPLWLPLAVIARLIAALRRPARRSVRG
jgi:hypothetical protein